MPCSTKPSYTNQASKQYEDTNKWLPNIWIIASRVIWRDNSYAPYVTLSKILVSEDLNYPEPNEEIPNYHVRILESRAEYRVFTRKYYMALREY